jgi:eukaryotic-like serine/threonine-protein kinase
MAAMASDLRAAEHALAQGQGASHADATARAIPPPLPVHASSAADAGSDVVGSGTVPSSRPPSGARPPTVTDAAAAVVPAVAGTAPRPRRRPLWAPLVTIFWIVTFAVPGSRSWVMEQIQRVRNVGTPASRPGGAQTAHELTQQGLDLLARFYRPGNVDASMELLEHAATLDPNHAPAYAAMARAFERKFAETRDKTWAARAVDAANRARALDRYLADGHLAAGVALRASGDNRAAERALQEAIGIDPSNGRVWLALGGIAYEEGRMPDASSAYAKAVQFSPRDWEAALGSGSVAYRAANYDEATRWFQRAISLAPDAPQPYTSAAAAYQATGDFAAAAAALQQAIRIQPTAPAYTNLGTALFLQGRYMESVAAFEKGVELQPANPLMWGNLGDAYRATVGGRTRASEAFQRAIQLLKQQLSREPNNLRDRSRLALYLAKSGDGKAALEQLATLGDLTERDVSSMYRAAVTFELAGDRRSALRWLGIALERGHSLQDAAADPDLAGLRGDVGYQRLAARFEATAR